MANPNNPVIYVNKKDHYMPWDYKGYRGYSVEICPVCEKGIQNADRKSIIVNGQHWHIHKLCSKKQHTIMPKAESD